MSRRRKRFDPKIKRNSTFLLNITSMTDMFTLLLVFLLQNFASSGVPLEPAKGVSLPASNSALNPVEGLKVTVSKDELRIDDRVIASLNSKQFQAKDLDPKDASFVPNLFNELNKLAENKDKDYLKEGRVLLQADASLPYETLRKVLYTASMAGFPQLKMVAMLGN